MGKSICITAQDKQRLLSCIESLEARTDTRELPHLRYLNEEIARANVIADPSATPNDVITMRSRVLLHDLARQTSRECTLAYPSECAPEEGSISVLAPLGAAMLGYSIGDTFDVALPKGPAAFRVEALLYQPESSGHFDR